MYRNPNLRRNFYDLEQTQNQFVAIDILSFNLSYNRLCALDYDKLHTESSSKLFTTNLGISKTVKVLIQLKVL